LIGAHSGLIPSCCNTIGVMPGLDPGIHLFAKKLDRRVKPGDDGRVFGNRPALAEQR
jgi:hypothetical protein